MHPISHPDRLLKREFGACGLSANRLALDLGVPSGCITDTLNGRRSITTDNTIGMEIAQNPHLSIRPPFHPRRPSTCPMS